MMEERDLLGFRLEVDTDAAWDWYAKAEAWGCTCGSCRNCMALARERKLPGPMLKILDSLGLPPEKAAYVCELSHDESGYCYESSYRIAGSILSRDATASVPLDRGGALCFHKPYPYGVPGFPKPHADLDFSMMLPWVPGEPE